MVFLYDGTYEGLLSAIFERYRLRASTVDIMPEDQYQEQLFGDPVRVTTQAEHAERVRQGVVRRSSERSERMLYRAFLTEQPGVEHIISHFVDRLVQSEQDISEDYRDPLILQLHQLDKKIGRELHRMHAFVRFQELQDGLYVAIIQPDFNVMPLLDAHFVARYPAQEWLIYDSRRQYGLLWDKVATRFITFTEQQQHGVRALAKEWLTAAEDDYQELWKTYFKSVDIPERRNMKLHLQHVPRRYWKYLVEKW